MDDKIDCILLACTHYQLLLKKIKQFVPANITIISQGEIVAESLKKYLNNHQELDDLCSKTKKRLFFTTGDEINFNEHASSFFGEPVAAGKINL